ncbi:Ribonuclease P protein component [Aristophania vespae]|nr:Ribonuclease P protein component [Aristophania vespae]
MTSGLIGQVLPHNNEGELRVGFTVTKKIGNAVIRNRARRRLKEAARHVMQESVLVPGDMVLIGRSQTLARPFEQLKGDVRRTLKKMHEGNGEKK